MWNDRAGGRPSPRVAAIVMTMVGSRSQIRSTPDRASRMYIERALSIAEKHAHLFDHANPADCFVLTDDFVSAGRISGAKSIPISRLKIISFHMVEGKAARSEPLSNTVSARVGLSVESALMKEAAH